MEQGEDFQKVLRDPEGLYRWVETRNWMKIEGLENYYTDSQKIKEFMEWFLDAARHRFLEIARKEVERYEKVLKRSIEKMVEKYFPMLWEEKKRDVVNKSFDVYIRPVLEKKAEEIAEVVVSALKKGDAKNYYDPELRPDEKRLVVYVSSNLIEGKLAKSIPEPKSAYYEASIIIQEGNSVPKIYLSDLGELPGATEAVYASYLYTPVKGWTVEKYEEGKEAILEHMIHPLENTIKQLIGQTILDSITTMTSIFLYILPEQKDFRDFPFSM